MSEWSLFRLLLPARLTGAPQWVLHEFSVQRAAARVALALFTLLIVAALLDAVAWRGWWFAVSVAAVLLTHMGLVQWTAWRLHQICKRVITDELNVCTHCGYTLRGTPQCPECGTAHNIEALHATWSAFLRRFGYPRPTGPEANSDA